MKTVVEGKSLVYHDIGRGPAVVFVPEAGADLKTWSVKADSLAKRGFRVVTIDPTALAKSSSAGNGVQSLGADRLVRLMNYLGIGRAAVIWAGKGETVVRDLIRRYPGRVATPVPAGVAALFDEFCGRVGGVFSPGEVQQVAV